MVHAGSDPQLTARQAGAAEPARKCHVFNIGITVVGVLLAWGFAMSDPNMNEFHGRVARIERAHALGLGFEADGTLGRSASARKPARKRPVLRSAVYVLALLIGLKAAILTQLGEANYQERVLSMRQGDALGRAGAFVMQADPATVWLSRVLRTLAS